MRRAHPLPDPRLVPATAAARPTGRLKVIAPIGDQGIAGLFVEEAVRGLAQPANLNGSLFGSKRDRKAAASIGSAKQ